MSLYYSDERAGEKPICPDCRLRPIPNPGLDTCGPCHAWHADYNDDTEENDQ